MDKNGFDILVQFDMKLNIYRPKSLLLATRIAKIVVGQMKECVLCRINEEKTAVICVLVNTCRLYLHDQAGPSTKERDLNIDNTEAEADPQTSAYQIHSSLFHFLPGRICQTIQLYSPSCGG